MLLPETVFNNVFTRRKHPHEKPTDLTELLDDTEKTWGYLECKKRRKMRGIVIYITVFTAYLQICTLVTPIFFELAFTDKAQSNVKYVLKSN